MSKYEGTKRKEEREKLTIWEPELEDAIVNLALAMHRYRRYSPKRTRKLVKQLNDQFCRKTCSINKNGTSITKYQYPKLHSVLGEETT